MALLRLTGLDPISALLSLQEQLDRFMGNPAIALGPSGVGVYPPVNIFESSEGAMVVAETPGMDPVKVSVTGKGHTLTLSGERKFEADANGVGYHRRELSEGWFSRSLQMPEEYDVSKAEARYEAGLLVIGVPRAEHAKERQIKVQSA